MELKMNFRAERGNYLDVLFGLVFWLGLTFIAAAVGAYASVNAKAFYAGLLRPAWAPPGWLFGPVWSVLYFLMGMAAFFVWRERGHKRVNAALCLYAGQLVLNSLWTWLFFAWRSGLAAAVGICALWALIVLTLVAFWKVRALAGILLAPYLIWVTFAMFLSFATWQMNPSVL